MEKKDNCRACHSMSTNLPRCTSLHGLYRVNTAEVMEGPPYFILIVYTLTPEDALSSGTTGQLESFWNQYSTFNHLPN